MPKICGVFYFDSDRTVEDEISTSLSALVKSPLDKTFCWTKNNVGLGQVERKTHYIKQDDLNIVADARITNRNEVFRKLSVLASERQHFSDARLILESYKKWGEAGVEHLIGDFAFAIYDAHRRKLFVARDHFGKSTLFYYKDAEKFVFASEPRGIYNFPTIEKKFNTAKLAIFLLPEPHTLSNDQSWFENISPVAAGTTLSVDGNGVKSKVYWKPEFEKKLLVKTEGEILESFREVFFEVIEAHLDAAAPSASLLSGGLDSSSIVSVAAKVLEKRNRSLNVFAGVLADQNDPAFSDERFYIDRFKNFPNVKINYVTPEENIGAFSGLQNFFDHYDSPFVTSRHFLYSALLREAETVGAETLFDGALGETGVSFHGHGAFAEMFANFRWRTLWRELKLRSALYGDSLQYNLRANVVNPLLPRFLIDLRHGRPARRISLNEMHPIRQSLALNLSHELNPSAMPQQRLLPDSRRNQIALLDFVYLKSTENPSSNFGGSPVELRFPLLDKRLVEFTLAAPLNLKIRNGYYRYLLRAALGGILPEEIRWRTTKTAFSPDYMRRFGLEIVNIRSFLDDIKPNDPVREILDIERLRSWASLPFADGESYTFNERIARDYLPQGIYLIYFLRKFSEFSL